MKSNVINVLISLIVVLVLLLAYCGITISYKNYELAIYSDCIRMAEDQEEYIATMIETYLNDELGYDSNQLMKHSYAY